MECFSTKYLNKNGHLNNKINIKIIKPSYCNEYIGN